MELYSNSVITQESDNHLVYVEVKTEFDSYNDTERPPETQTPSTNTQCRICLDQCDESTLRPLFSCRDLSRRFETLMLPHFHHSFGARSMHLQETDTPDKICDDCLEDFEHAEKFIKKVVQSEVVLRRELNKRSQKQIFAMSEVPPLMKPRERPGTYTGVRKKLPSAPRTNFSKAADLGDLDKDPMLVPGDKVKTPVVRCYTRKSSAKNEPVQMSVSCLDEGSGVLKDPLGEDQAKVECNPMEHVTAELGPLLPVVELPSFRHVPVPQKKVRSSEVVKKLKQQTFHQRRLKYKEKKQGEHLQALENYSRKKTNRPNFKLDCANKTEEQSWHRHGVGQLCEHCGEVLTVSKRKHVKTSLTCCDRMITCGECGKQFRFKNELVSHMPVHSGEFPFACHLCPMKYAYHTNLNRHLALHEVGNAYVCDTCGKCKWSRVIL